VLLLIGRECFAGVTMDRSAGEKHQAESAEFGAPKAKLARPATWIPGMAEIRRARHNSSIEALPIRRPEMRISRAEKSRRKPGEIIFDGAGVTATAESSQVVKVQGYAVSETDQYGALAIRGGNGFVLGAYRICAVDRWKNTWTLDRPCCAGSASGLVGKMTPLRGKPHKVVKEYYDPTLPDDPSQGEARDRLIGMLDRLEPRILKSLADMCFKDELLEPPGSNEGDWASGSCEHLSWGHIRRAGDVLTGSEQAYLRNLKPLRDELTRWAEGGPERAWNLLDNEKKPLDWIASAAVQTLVFWKLRGGLPKVLQWENFELRAYRSLETVEDFSMLGLERHFDAGSDFMRISPAKGQEHKRLSARQQRIAEREYAVLGKKRGLKRMPREISSHYFNWFAQYTFLGLRLKEIRQRQMKRRAVGVGDVNDPEDLAAVWIGIKKIADLVGFRRTRKRTGKF